MYFKHLVISNDKKLTKKSVQDINKEIKKSKCFINNFISTYENKHIIKIKNDEYSGVNDGGYRTKICNSTEYKKFLSKYNLHGENRDINNNTDNKNYKDISTTTTTDEQNLVEIYCVLEFKASLYDYSYDVYKIFIIVFNVSNKYNIIKKTTINNILSFNTCRDKITKKIYSMPITNVSINNTKQMPQ